MRSRFALAAWAVVCLSRPSLAEVAPKTYFGVDVMNAAALFEPAGPWQTSVLVGKEVREATLRTPGMRMIGGGLGWRVHFGSARGVRASFGFAASFGRAVDTTSGAELGSGASFALGSSLGYQYTIGPVTLHTATVGTWRSFDVTLDAAAAPYYPLTREGLRVGQEIGIHARLGPIITVFADGAMDYDGAWRVQAGIGFSALDLAGRSRRARPAEVEVSAADSSRIDVHADGDLALTVRPAPGARVSVNASAGGDLAIFGGGAEVVVAAPGGACATDRECAFLGGYCRWDSYAARGQCALRVGSIPIGGGSGVPGARTLGEE